MQVKRLTDKLRNNKYLFGVIFVIVILYPLRWTFSGLDFWDTGYSCGNYVNFGPDHMSSVWFFSTYLANLTGHMMSLLPYGDTLAGLRIYSGLLVSLNVLVSGLFCINTLKIDRWSVIAGEILAVSLCFCPTVILYNQLTYFCIIMAGICIYKGLAEERTLCIFIAGFILGLNVFVRFSNITQAAFAVAVLYYAVINKKTIKYFLSNTMIFLFGFISAFAMILGIISIKYGAGRYIAGISGLFGFAETSSEYSMVSMIRSMIVGYMKGFRRIADMFVFAALAGALTVLFAKLAKKRSADSLSDRMIDCIGVITGDMACVYFALKQLMQFDFRHFTTIILTAAMFIDVALMISLMMLADKKACQKDKLIAVLMIIHVAVLSVGSNTGVMPVACSMFIIAPFMIYGLGVYLKRIKKAGFLKGNKRILIRLTLIVMTICVLCFYTQCILFGAGYNFQEAENGAGGRYMVTDNYVIKNIRMSEDRASLMQGLNDYINYNGLKGKGVIIYGYAPSLAFYLQLKPVISAWPDLDSYSLSEMKGDIDKLQEDIDRGDTPFPLMIIDRNNLKEQQEHDPEKWAILNSVMSKYVYEETFSCGRFSVYRSEKDIKGDK